MDSIIIAELSSNEIMLIIEINAPINIHHRNKLYFPKTSISITEMNYIFQKHQYPSPK